MFGMAPNLSNFPRELLLEFFKLQTDINDVLTLSTICGQFRQIWLSNFRTITDSVLSRQICCYTDAIALSEMQQEMEPECRRNEIHSSTSDDADGEASSNLEFKSRLRHLLAINREVQSILTLAQEGFVPHARRGRTDCDVHPGRLLPHESERVASGFYFLRRCVLAQSNPSLKSDCQIALERMDVAKLYVLWEMLHWLCETLDAEVQQKLGIWDDDPPDHLIGIQATFTVPQWDQARDMVTDAYCDKRRFGEDEYETRLFGPCDQCNINVCGSGLPVQKFWEYHRQI